jgi:hypothetical protein
MFFEAGEDCHQPPDTGARNSSTAPSGMTAWS